MHRTSKSNAERRVPMDEFFQRSAPVLVQLTYRCGADLASLWQCWHSNIPGTFWFGRFDAMKKIDQIKEANEGIALATGSLDNEEIVHFAP